MCPGVWRLTPEILQQRQGCNCCSLGAKLSTCWDQIYSPTAGFSETKYQPHGGELAQSHLPRGGGVDRAKRAELVEPLELRGVSLRRHCSCQGAFCRGPLREPQEAPQNPSSCFLQATRPLGWGFFSSEIISNLQKSYKNSTNDLSPPHELFENNSCN